ncbi:MAG: hypothetical protein QXO33_03290 [Nitrososphaeria archaeon]
MKVKRLSTNSAEIIPETIEDMLFLRLYISREDLISAKTIRTIKFEKNFSRHAEKERKIVILTIRVDEVCFENTFDTLKISGLIEATSDEHVHKGTRHSLEINLHTKFLLIKEDNQIDFELLEQKIIKEHLILVSLDSQVAGVGEIKGSQIKYITEIYSDYQGKLYDTKQEWIKSYYKQIFEIITSLNQANKIVVFGPGPFKLGFKNYLENSNIGKKMQIIIVDGIEYGGFDGIRQAINSEVFSRIFRDNYFSKAKTIMEKILSSLYKGDSLSILSIEKIEKAAVIGACESLLIAKDFLSKNIIEENKMVHIFSNILKHRGTIYFLDNNTNVGIQLNTLGGIAAYLRYRIE